MPTATLAGRAVQTDNDGFLTDSNEWSEEIAQAIANEVGVTLGDTHWKVVRFAREDFRERHESPGPRRITAETGVSTKDLYALFPKGPGKLVAKIAGVPKPKSCL
ncbi:MAG: TusE/DsrC/DsvC family sulfur relay protein [Polyangiales bacterium]